MDFKVGDPVVVPLSEQGVPYGPGRIVRIEPTSFAGEHRECLIIEMDYGLTVAVPTDTAREVGLRLVTPKADLPRLFEYLAQDAPTPRGADSTGRLRANIEAMRSNSIYEIADLTRELHHRATKGALSPGERRLLSRARQRLVNEIAYSLDSDDEAAGNLVDDALGVSTPLHEPPDRPAPLNSTVDVLPTSATSPSRAQEPGNFSRTEMSWRSEADRIIAAATRAAWNVHMDFESDSFLHVRLVPPNDRGYLGIDCERDGWWGVALHSAVSELLLMLTARAAINIVEWEDFARTSSKENLRYLWVDDADFLADAIRAGEWTLRDFVGMGPPSHAAFFVAADQTSSPTKQLDQPDTPTDAVAPPDPLADAPDDDESLSERLDEDRLHQETAAGRTRQPETAKLDDNVAFILEIVLAITTIIFFGLAPVSALLPAGALLYLLIHQSK